MKIRKLFLVISYDSDEQQWFHDTVYAPSADAAEERILNIRPYVLAANVYSLEELTYIRRNIEIQSFEDTEKALADIQRESGVELEGE